MRPSGSVTCASAMSAVLISFDFSFCGTWTSVSTPSGVSYCEVSGVTVAVGRNGTLSQPSTPTGGVVGALSRSVGA